MLPVHRTELPHFFSVSTVSSETHLLFGRMNASCLYFSNPIEGAISKIRFAPISNSLLISSWDSNLRLYDVDKCQLRLEAPADGAGLLDCCFENESVAVAADSDGCIRRYDLHLGKNKIIGNHDDVATCAEYSETTCQTITAGYDKKVKFWDARSNSSFRSLNKLCVDAESISVSGVNLMVALKSSVHLYDLRYLDGSVQEKEHMMGIHIKCVRLSSDLKGFIVGSVDGRVALEYLLKSNLRNEGYAFRCHPKDRNGNRHLVAVNDIAFDPSIRGVLVTGDNDGHAIIWDTASKKRLEELPKCPNGVTSLAYNHSGQLLAIASSYAYHEGDEREESPQIFLHHMDNRRIKPVSDTSSQGKSMHP